MPVVALHAWLDGDRTRLFGDRFTGMVLGSTSHALLHHSAGPVLVVRARNRGAERR